MKRILFFLNRAAILLRPIRIILVVFTFIALLLTAYLLIVPTTFTPNALEPSILATLWGMLLLANSELFQKLPGPVRAKDSFMQRILSRCKLFFYGFLAIATLFVTVLLVWISLRLLLI